MKPARSRIFWIVFGTHAGAIVTLLILPSLLRGCARPKPKEAVIFIAPAIAPVPEPILPHLAPAPPEPEPEPTPEPEPEPEPATAPTPEPRPTPQPKKSTPVPQKKKSTPAPQKKKWTPQPVVRQNRRVTRRAPQKSPPQPQPNPIRARDIQQALRGATTSAASEHLRYCSRIQPPFYAVWQQPAAPLGTRATATIRVDKNGRLTYRILSAPSGNRAFDQSVRAALQAISQLPRPPSDSAHRNITIDFVLN